MSVYLSSMMGGGYASSINQSNAAGGTPFTGSLNPSPSAMASQSLNASAYGGASGSQDIASLMMVLISQILTMLVTLLGGLGNGTANTNTPGTGNNGQFGNPYGGIPPTGGGPYGGGARAGNLNYPLGRNGQPIPLKDHGNQGSVMRWGNSIQSASRKTGVPASLIAAMIDQESGGNARAASTNPGNGQTDTGLMQMNPGTLKDLQSRHPELQGLDMGNPDNQILASSTLMAEYLQEFNGDVGKALRKYNSGTVPADIHTGPGGTDPDYIMSVIGHQPLYASLD